MAGEELVDLPDIVQVIWQDELYDVRGFADFDGDPEEDMDDCGGDFEGWD